MATRFNVFAKPSQLENWRMEQTTGRNISRILTLDAEFNHYRVKRRHLGVTIDPIALV